jgi:hypothetical protein
VFVFLPLCGSIFKHVQHGISCLSTFFLYFLYEYCRLPILHDQFANALVAHHPVVFILNIFLWLGGCFHAALCVTTGELCDVQLKNKNTTQKTKSRQFTSKKVKFQSVCIFKKKQRRKRNNVCD